MKLLVLSLALVTLLGDVFAQGRTPAPHFTLDPTSGTTFTIYWEHPDTPATITGWRIQYREAGFKKQQVDIAGYFTEQLITGLKPSTQYKVRIMAKTDQGNGKYTDWLGVFTPAETPVVEQPPSRPSIPESPQNVVADPSTDSARITWEPPVDTGAEVVGYVLSYDSPDIPGSPNTFTLRPNPTYTDLTGLTPNVLYELTLTAYNSGGQSYPARINFYTSLAVEEIAYGPPPPVENVQYTNLSPTSIQITWTIPQTTEADEIESIRFGFGDASIPVDYLPASDLRKDTTNYIAEQLTPDTQYTIMLVTQNSYGGRDPVVLSAVTSPEPVVEEPEVPEQVVVPPPMQIRADVLSPTTVRVSFVDPSIGHIQEVSTHDRYYTLRYKRESDPGFEYANIRETTHIVDYLRPESNYMFEVMVVLARDLQSEYSQAVYAYTRDQNAEGLPSDVTAIQVKVTNPGLLSAVINWLPPRNQQQQIQGYVLEYTSGIDITASNVWERIDINGEVPTATVEPLMANTTYHIRVAPRIANQVADFSDPPEVFLTPTVPPSGQPLQVCSGSETTEQVVERVTWMRDGGGGTARPALVGVPLPYCDDYYGIHECHFLVCFCIPGKRPRTDPACSGDGLQGDQPFPGSSSAATPCRAEYDLARRRMGESRRAGKPLEGVHLPYCTEEGYYQPKQCSGSVCYCSTWDGQHTGKEVPLWEAASLDC